MASFKILSSLLISLSISMAYGQTTSKAYTYVQQDGTVLEADGLAGFEVSADSHPTVEFVDGKAVMTIGTNTVAALPMSDKGQLIVEFTNYSGITTDGSLPVTVSSEGYGTIYSPFQLSVPTNSNVKVYAPSYDAESHTLKCNETTIIAAGSIIPVGTALLLKNSGDITFGISPAASTDVPSTELSGSALTIPTSSVSVSNGEVIYTLGHELTDPTLFGFFEYLGTSLSPAKAYLVADKQNPSQAKYISLSFDDEASGISLIDNEPSIMDYYKFIDNGRVVIIKNGRKFNLNGQEVR